MRKLEYGKMGQVKEIESKIRISVMGKVEYGKMGQGKE